MGAQRIIGPVSTPEDRPELHVIDIFVMSVKCGNCDAYQTIVKFRKGAEKNVYTYECENEICDPERDADLPRGANASRQLHAPRRGASVLHQRNRPGAPE